MSRYLPIALAIAVLVVIATLAFVMIPRGGREIATPTSTISETMTTTSVTKLSTSTRTSIGTASPSIAGTVARKTHELSEALKTVASGYRELFENVVTNLSKEVAIKEKSIVIEGRWGRGIVIFHQYPEHFVMLSTMLPEAAKTVIHPIDGRRIVVGHGSNLIVMDTVNGSVLAKLRVPGTIVWIDSYGSKLVVIYQSIVKNVSGTKCFDYRVNNVSVRICIEPSTGVGILTLNTVVEVMDLQSSGKVTILDRHTVSGRFLYARIVDGVLYLATIEPSIVLRIEPLTPVVLVPVVDGVPIPSNELAIVGRISKYGSYVTILAMDLKNFETNHLSMLVEGCRVYVVQQGRYIAIASTIHAPSITVMSTLRGNVVVEFIDKEFEERVHVASVEVDGLEMKIRGSKTLKGFAPIIEALDIVNGRYLPLVVCQGPRIEIVNRNVSIIVNVSSDVGVTMSYGTPGGGSVIVTQVSRAGSGGCKLYVLDMKNLDVVYSTDLKNYVETVRVADGYVFLNTMVKSKLVVANLTNVNDIEVFESSIDADCAMHKVGNVWVCIARSMFFAKTPYVASYVAKHGRFVEVSRVELYESLRLVMDRVVGRYVIVVTKSYHDDYKLLILFVDENGKLKKVGELRFSLSLSDIPSLDIYVLGSRVIVATGRYVEVFELPTMEKKFEVELR